MKNIDNLCTEIYRLYLLLFHKVLWYWHELSGGLGVKNSWHEQVYRKSCDISVCLYLKQIKADKKTNTVWVVLSFHNIFSAMRKSAETGLSIMWSDEYPVVSMIIVTHLTVSKKWLQQHNILLLIQTKWTSSDWSDETLVTWDGFFSVSG